MKWQHNVSYLVRVHPYCCRCQRKRTMLKTSQPIPATPWTNKTGLCEYSGTERPVDPQEHVNSIPLRQLMYGCEYCRGGKLYRKSPDQDMDSLLRYMQAPNPGEEPTCRLMIVKDKAKSTMVSLFINRPIQTQDGESFGTISQSRPTEAN
jgi:hypothetical protein